ncbi:MAG: glycosyltransferase [Aureispira sp.]
MERKTILVAALNWGLGHATRCIPIINALQAQGVQVVLASDGAALALWREHYPQLHWVALPSYNIHYPSSNMVWNIVRQLPHILKAIRTEKKQVATIIQQYAIDAIISDNRYGLRSTTVPSVFVGHQLHLALPYWVIPPLVNALHQRFITAFDACWVPDRAGVDNLAGSLAHPPLRHTQYLGALSRFSAVVPLPPKWDILAVLSGPEPQRQYLEAALQEQLLALPYKSLIVRGKPSSQQLEQIGLQLYQQDFMPQAALQTAFAQSQWVVTRSGYSTLLDLAALQVAPPLLIPTPGQTEQEYLAQRLAQQGRCITQQQSQLDVKAGIEALSKLKLNPLTPPSISSLEQIIQEWLPTI